MGCNVSISTVYSKPSDYPIGQVDDSTLGSSPSNNSSWKILLNQADAALQFEKEGTLKKNSVPEMLNFRALLDDPVAFSFLSQYSVKLGLQSLLLCWKDIHQFRNVQDVNRRCSIGVHIYETYVKDKELLYEDEETLLENIRKGDFHNK